MMLEVWFFENGKIWVGREVGGGIGMGKTCEPKAFSFRCMTKFTTNKKKRKKMGKSLARLTGAGGEKWIMQEAKDH